MDALVSGAVVEKEIGLGADGAAGVPVMEAIPLEAYSNDPATSKSKKAKPTAEPPFEFRFIDIGYCFDNEPPPMDFVMPGFLAGTVGGLTAPGGVGKSTWAFEAAIEIAIAEAGGGDFLGLDVRKHGRVKILAGEDPEIALWHRLKAIQRLLPPDQRDAVKANLQIAKCVGMGIDITQPRFTDALMRAAEGVRLMVIDTLTRFHSLDENSAADAKLIMSIMEQVADKTGCAILFLHHVSKSSAMNGMADLQQAARGSSVFVDNARWLSFVAGMSVDEAKTYGISDDQRRMFVRWNISKQNYSGPLGDLWFRRCEGGVLVRADLEVIEPDPTTDKKPKAKKGSTW